MSADPEEVQSGTVTFGLGESHVFPPYDDCFRSARLPFLRAYVTPIVIYMQLMGATLWISCSNIWGVGAPAWLRVLFLAFTSVCTTRRGPPARSRSSCSASLLFLCGVFFSYRASKSFARWRVHIVVIILYTVFPVCVGPLRCVGAGHSRRQLGRE